VNPSVEFRPCVWRPP